MEERGDARRTRLVAFFTGGSVAGMTSAMRGAVTGALNGFLVWALGSVLILLLSALGLGQLFGTSGRLVGQFGLVLFVEGSLQAPVDVLIEQNAQGRRPRRNRRGCGWPLCSPRGSLRARVCR